MPNGVSCAYFAARNLVSGTKEHNIFREGIATAQTFRTVDAVANSSAMASSVPAGVKNGCSFLAKLSRKILYPLIIASGIYNTTKSDDKVKTGISQGGAIASMFCFETALEKIQKKVVPNIINTIKPKLSETTLKKIKDYTINLSSNKYGRIFKYVLQGILFATVSMTGYTVGSNVSAKIVDKVRKNKFKNSSSNEVESSYTSPKYNENVFDDIEVIKE